MVSSSAKRKQEFIAEIEREFGLVPEDTEEASDEPILTFREFVDRVYPKYQWYKHCEVLGESLQRVADGNLKRLMVFMPPRQGKSQLASKLFPAYYLYRHPDRFVGVSAYSAELAYTFSRACRDAYRTIGCELKDDAASVKHWETGLGGGLWSCGIGGSLTGRGGSLLLIDDPVKNAEEANSETIRRKHQEWYESTFYTRSEPSGAIIVIQTRWHESDLSGWLLQQEESGENPEQWHIINFEAIKQEEPIRFPPTCTIEPDWREVGEALCPERYNVASLSKIKTKIGSRFFESLYQQRPSAAEGNLFKRDWWKYYTVAPARFEQVIMSWDCAFKETKNSDYVVGQVWGQNGGEFYLLDQVRDRMDINGTLAAIRSLSAKYPQASAKLIEDKANGSAVIDLLRREISGLIPVQPEGGKVVRANAVAPYCEAGNVYLPDPSIAPWVHDLVEEASAFPNGAHDDQIDSLSQSLTWLASHVTADWIGAI